MMYHDAYQVYDLLDKWNPQGPPQPDQVLDLFRRDPAEARQEFLYGQTLLHKCVEYYSNRIDLVRIFLNANPPALTQKDANGFLPIHRSLMSGDCGALLIELFVEQAPETLLETTPNGELPLHLACARYEKSIVRYLVDCFPESIQHRDNVGRFPLQHALDAERPQPAVVQLLLEHYPVILSFLDEEGYLPLHRVLQKQQKSRYDSIVELFVQYCPGALRYQATILEGTDNEDDDEDSDDEDDSTTGPQQRHITPLVMACQQNCSLSQVYSLVRSWPEQVTREACSMIFDTTRFNGEMLPSALASSSATLARLKAWVHLYPNVIYIPDLQGRLPLHYAALSKSKDAVEMVEFILSSQQDFDDDDDDDDESSSTRRRGCQVADHHGRLPLHYAAAVGNGEIVSLLTADQQDSRASGLMQADKDGRLPWHYAECARLDGVYEQTLLEYQNHINNSNQEKYDRLLLLEGTISNLDLVPDEIRWDVLQIVHDEQW